MASSSDPNSPAVPAYIFRGHASAIHALHFFSSNSFLASADSDGWLVIWSLTSRRAVAVWKAHGGGILGTKNWGNDRLITHGRDHKLRVWSLQEGDFQVLDLELPVDGADAKTAQQPWLLHSMDVNALNFCAFATCTILDGEIGSPESVATLDESKLIEDGSKDRMVPRPILFATPNGLDSGGVDFFHLPSERRVSKLPADSVTKTGMIMAVSLLYNSSRQLTVISGYEDGHTMVHVRQDTGANSEDWNWQKVLTSRPHSQPILSLGVTPVDEFYVTSSADAIIAKFGIPSMILVGTADTKPARLANTKHAGQQGLCMRSDGKIFATAGWDARIRVYSSKTLKELAVLKWHKDGCYAVAFADVNAMMSVDGKKAESTEVAVVSQENKSALDIIKQERSSKACNTHWLAAGGKDGKISLWDIY